MALAGLTLLSALAPGALAQDARKKQDIVFAELSPRTVGDAPITLAAKSTSGLPVTFELVSGPAVLDGKTLRLTNVPGLVIIRASQEGNDSFMPAVVAERAFAVNDRPTPPAIVSQPVGTRAAMGEIVMLSVQASGEPRPSLQWRKDGSPLSGATESRLTIASVAPGDAGDYDVVATNTLGSATSSRAHVAIGKRSQTISFQGSTSVSVGQPLMLNASASSGLPVRFDIISGVAVISGSTLTASQGGTVVVQASQTGDSTYDPAAPVMETYLVNVSLNAQRIP
jgi:hypothetical protein